MIFLHAILCTVSDLTDREPDFRMELKHRRDSVDGRGSWKMD